MKPIIIIDESGTLSDPNDKVVVIAAVGTQLSQNMSKIAQSVRKFQKKNNMTEIKFYKSGDRTKKKYIEKLIREPVDIFVLIVEKEGKKIEDSPENFALLCWIILEDCLPFYNREIKQIIFDRHFHQKNDQELFDYTLTNLLQQQIDSKHADSQKDQRISAADMIAGSLLWAKTGKDSSYYNLIKPKIISEKLISWRQIKKKLWHKKMSEPVQAPIQTIKTSLRQSKKFVKR